MDTIVRNLPAESFISIEGNKRHYWKWNDERNEEKSLVRKPEEEEEGLEPEEDLKEDEEEDLWAELDDSPQSQRPSLQSQREGAPSPALVSSHPSLANQVLSEGLKAALDEEIRRDIANAQRVARKR